MDHERLITRCLEGLFIYAISAIFERHRYVGCANDLGSLNVAVGLPGGRSPSWSRSCSSVVERAPAVKSSVRNLVLAPGPEFEPRRLLILLLSRYGDVLFDSRVLCFLGQLAACESELAPRCGERAASSAPVAHVVAGRKVKHARVGLRPSKETRKRWGSDGTRGGPSDAETTPWGRREKKEAGVGGAVFRVRVFYRERTTRRTLFLKSKTCAP